VSLEVCADYHRLGELLRVLMFTLILVANFIALAFVALATASRPTRTHKLILAVAACGFLCALYQFDTRRFNPLVLASTALLNLFLASWLVKLSADGRKGRDREGRR
jgi:hypothetical protein